MEIPLTFKEILTNGGIMMGLSRHQQRLDYSLVKLAQAGFSNIDVFYGVDGFSEPTEDILNANGWKLLNAPIRNEPGAIGSTLTNLFLWRKLIEENLPYLLIFEDDVLPHPDISVLGEQFWRETPPDWDFLFLGNNMDCNTDDKVVQVPCFCTHAYLVSNKGAKLAFELIANDDNGIDKADCQLITWMNKKMINWYCWNGKTVKKPYKTSQEVFNENEDVIELHTSTGVIYQNYRLGTTIRSEQVQKH